ncbi:MAG: GbsR/MarR family transcriptional regulator [Pseudomonadota bacterium]
MQLTPIQSTFVMHFGEMGSRWGVSRTVGQIYAVLFLSERALCADEIVEALGVSRSNVSMGLKELQSWRLVRLSHQQGDRRDYYSTPGELWDIVRTLAEQRKAREIDPTLTVLRELQMQEPSGDADAYAQKRIQETAELIELLTGWFDEVNRLETRRIEQLLSLGAQVQRVLDWKDRLTIMPGGKDK